jgi:Ca2+-transporting ATPase
MARGHAIARRLPAVETLGSVTVVASDKTGTVTEGRMAVQRAVTADGRTVTVRGVGYAPTGSVDGAPPPVALARAAVLCNDAHLVPPTGDVPQWGVAGDPLEGALIAFAARCGVDAATERSAAVRVAEQPFDALTRRMVTVHSRPEGRFLVVCKGAPEVVLTPDVVDAPPDQLAGTISAARDLAEDGLRVLAFAAGQTDDPGSDPARGLHLLGLVGIADPVRAGAPEVAETFRRAGIRLVLITGDHPATAARVAGRLDTWREGDEVARGDDGDLSRHDPERVSVYARIRPEQKLDIIAALQERGHVVAMTGDGVNDAPALRRADIGVAMGRSGTEVARQAADLVLTDDNLATVAAAVGEGRRIYANIRRFLRYALSGGVAELAVMLTGPFLGLAVPLLPAQILWVNLLTHGLPGVALGAEPAAPETMQRPPRSPQESVLGGGLTRAILTVGALIATCVLGAAVIVRTIGGPWQSVAFVVLGLAQLGVALAVRAPRRRGGPRNPALGAAVALSAILQIVAVEWTPLMNLLGTQRLSVAQLVACAAVATVPCAALLAARALRRRPRTRPRGALPPDGTDSPNPRADARAG